MTRLMDAAMGTALLAQGINPLRAPLTHPSAVASVHRAHVAAGAEAVLTATFQASPLTVGDELERLGQAAVRLARSSGAVLVLGSIGPMGWPREFPSCEALARTVEALDGVDAILLETCSTPAALEAAAFVFHRLGREVWLSLACRHAGGEGRVETASGHAPEVFARHARRHGVAVLGVNCGKDISPADVRGVLGRFRQETDLPLLARPNAADPAEFAGLEADWVGGCCGTGVEHLRAAKGVAA